MHPTMQPPLYQFITITAIRRDPPRPPCVAVGRQGAGAGAPARHGRDLRASASNRLRGPFSNTNSAAQARGRLALGTLQAPVCGSVRRRRTDPQNEIFFKTIHYVISRYVDRGPHRAHADSPTARHAGACAVWPSRWPRDKRTCVTSVIVRSSKLMASNSRFAHLIQSSESLSDGRPRFHLLAC
jgi:hypothetical protein